MKNIFFSKILTKLLLISALLTFGFSQGQTKRVLANWMGGNASSISFPYNGDYSNPITTGCSMNYSGITPQNDNRFFFTANPSSTLNTSTSPYISFTINAGSSSIDLDRIVFQSYAGASLNTSLRYSVDGYTSNLGSITANGSSYSLTSVNLNSLANITGTVEFRMYFYGNASSTSIMLGSTGSAYSSVDGTPSFYGPTPVAPPTGYSWSSVSFWYNLPPEVPKITSFSPKSGAVGSSVTIYGSGFDSTSTNNIVYFGDVKANVTSATTTQLVVTVPSGGSGKVNVTNISSKLTAYSGKYFSVTYANGGHDINDCAFPVATSITSITPTVRVGTAWHDSRFNPTGSGDFDDDGKIDIVKVNGSATTKGFDVYRNTSSGIGDFNFSIGAQVSSTRTLSSVLVADYNNDGKLDVAVTDGSNFEIHMNTSTVGSISFASPVIVAAGSSLRNMLGDVNGDGKIDIIYAQTYGSTINLLLNTSTNGTLSFNNAITYIGSFGGNRGLGVGDFNNDFKTDVVAGDEWNNGNTGGSIYLSTSGSTITTPTKVDINSIIGNGFEGVVEAIDINGDGKDDVLKRGYDSLILSQNNWSSGTMTSSNFSAAISETFSGYTSNHLDMNGDGKIDLIGFNILGSGVYSIKNMVGTTITAAELINQTIDASVSSPWGGFIGDFDLDGRNDVISFTPGSVNSTIKIFKNSAPPVITTAGTINSFVACSGTASTPQSITVSGQNLTSSITLTAPTNFEISLSSASGYAASLTLSPTTGTVSSTTIYIRTKSTASGSLSGNLTLAATCTTTQSIALSGTVNAVTAISVHPSTTAQSVCQGTALTALSVTASGTSLTYQWYSNTTASTTGSTLITGATSASYTPVNSTPSELYYYCVVTGTCGTVTSNISALRTVSATPVAGTAAASATSICSGSTSTLSLTGSTGNIQWQSSPNNSTWTNISGATSTSYTTPALTTTTYYRAQISSGNCTAVTSTVLTITVNAVTAISVHPSTTAQSVCQGTALTALSVTASGTSLTYQWYSNTTASTTGSTLITGATSASYTPVNSTPSELYYYCVVTGTCGTVTSNISALRTVSATPVAGTAAASATSICSGSTSTLSLTGSTGTIQWQSSPNNSTWTNISGATSTSYTTPALTTTTYYRAQISSGNCTAVTSTVLTITVNTVALPTATTNIMLCEGDTAAQLTATAASGHTLQWYTVATGGTASTTAPTPSTSSAGTTTYYVSQLNNSSNCESGRVAITVKVFALPAAPTAIATINYCQGATSTALTATATTGYSLQWYTVATGGTASTTAPTPTTTATGATIYYVSQKENSGSFSISTTHNSTIPWGNNQGQTFQVPNNVILNSITMSIVYWPSASTLTLKIYNGIGGALLATANNVFNGVALHNYNVAFSFANQNLQLNTGQNYYFELTSPQNFYVWANSSSVYSGGTAVLNGAIQGGDLGFILDSTLNVNPCESPRTAITVNVNENPTISGVQNMTLGGNTITLSGTGTPHSTTPWASSNPAVATITSSGVVTAVGGGITTITYLTASGCSKTATIRVVDCAQPFGNALAFGVGSTAASADFVNIPSRIFPSQTVTDFTIETWIKPAASDIMSGTPGNSWLSFLGYTGTKRSPSLYITNNGVLHASWTEGFSFTGTPVNASSPTSLVANKWTHVALVKEGTTARLYADGIQIQSITCGATIDVPDNAYWLGKTDNQFNGVLDEVRFWSTARTQAQIQATMNTELVGNEAGLLTYFDFNEGIAGGTNTSITTVTNKANNALNGTLTNFTKTGTSSNFVGNSVSSTDITGAATICGNTTTQYSHQISGGTWSVSSGASATISTSGLLTATTNETITLSYTYTLNGCSFTASKAVVINSPAGPITNTTVNLCQGIATTALTATVTTGNTLQWYTVPTGGTASTTAPTPSVTTLGTTMYYVSQKNNTTNCESARTAITVTVNATPTISGAQSITVGGTPLQLTGSGTPDATTPWTSSNVAAATVSSTGVVTAFGAGSTIITYTSANGCSATAVISVVDCSQPFGNALQFDGVDDSFSTASNLSALSITGNITLETWIKFDQVHADWVRLIGKGDNNNRNYGLWLATTGKLLFQIYGGTALGLESTTALQPGIWYHISATRNGNTAKIYINGIEDATTSTTVTPQTNNFPLTVGYGNMHTWLKGALDEVRVWNVARTLTQIQQGMYNALVGNETGLVAYYDFNQGIAGGNNSTINAVLDRTTNVLHGTLTNFAKTGTASNFVGNTAANFAITGAATLCANGTAQYTHQVSGGTWSLSSGANATISTTGLLTAAGNEDITVSYTYVVNGCTLTATKSISINTPAAPLAATTVNLCQGITATALTATATTGNTLQWYTVPTGGTASTTAPTPNVTTLGTTTFYVSQKNNTTNCESTRTAIVVTVNPIPTITGIQNMTVGGTTLQLTGSGTPDATTPWVSSNTAVATISASGEVTAVAGGTTTITYTTDSGCTKTALLNVIDCTAPFGNALNFDGVDDYAVLDNVGSNSALQFANTTNYTLEAWVNRSTPTSTNGVIISKQNGGVAGNYSLGISAAGIPFVSREASPWAVSATTSIPPNEWTHIAGVFDGASLKIYINGVLNNSVSTSGSISASSVTAIKVALGCMYNNNVPSNFFKGSIDEVRIWNIARTASQIQQASRMALQGNEAGLVAYYDFNQGLPGGNNTVITSVVNTVNSTSNGVLTNFAKTGTTSNFVNSISTLDIAGASAVCANSTSQFTHPISGGTWSVSSGAASTVSTSGLLTTIGSENITVSYNYTINGCTKTATRTIEVVTPAITSQPATTAQNVCVNGVTASLSVTATGTGLTYQWYRNTTASNTGGTLISGATNSVYMPSNTLVGTTYYYCVVSNTCSSPMTSAVSGAIIIAPTSVSGTITGTASICSGSTTTLTLTGNVGTVQWQIFNGTTWNNITGATTNTFTTPALTQNTTYRAVVTSGLCSVANTIDFNVVVNPLPVISGTSSVGAGESVTLTATSTPASSNAWVSSNPAVATVTPNGVVNGLTLGTTIITYTNTSGCTDTETITVTVGTTQVPILTLPASNTTGATTLNFNYTLPETPLAGSVRLTFTPVGGGTPIVWTMTNATSAVFNYVVGSNPTAISNVVAGAALGFTTYNVTLSYQDAFSNPAASVTNTNIQTLAPPSISFASTNYTGLINQSIAIQTVNAGGGMVSYSISPILPAGLSLNTTTGLISGIPTVTLVQTSFTVTATNAAGTDSESFTLFIDLDTDGDGIGNATDPDIDGDGTPNAQDTNPINPCVGFNASTASSSWLTSDCDGDGIPNGSDADVDGNGTTDNGTDTDGDGINDANDPDIDGDGIPNSSDADPDGDGVITNGPDTDGDGINDANDPDIDGDGIPNSSDSDPDGNGTINNGPDTDGDGINDANDPDIDGDGIPNYADADANGDGTIDNGAVDTDGDGIVDGADSDANGDGVIDNGPDTDGDGVNDANDPDIDGDGIPNGADADPDGNGTINNGPDTDNDGINDANDPDIDGDGILNGADADPDGNGTINNGPDTDNDGINDANDPDIDGDGIPNGADADPDGDGTINNGPDTDGDGINNAADADPDDDGIINNGPDTDNDGINDANDPDIDGDGIPNGADADPDGNGTNNNGSDMDGDGINDANDPDIDGDGIPNNIDNCPNIVNPSISTQPSTQVVDVCPNTTPPTLSVVAVGQQLEYQWYVNTTNSNIGGTAITGATAASYIPSNTLIGPKYYYVIVFGTCGIAKSNVSGAITVQDITPPTVIAQNISVALNASGNATITAAQINNGSTDNCNIATMNVVPNTFTCANIGTNTVTLTIIDASGNSNTASAIVTVTETILPVVVTQNVTVNLNSNGQATITAAQINNGSSDNCGIANISVSPSTFTCANVGPNTVTLTVTDVNGNVKTGTAIVTVSDITAPTVQTQNVSVTLNAQGTATVTAAQVNNGSIDNCSIATMTVFPNSFTCANIGANTVTLTVTDVNGNVSTGTAVVTVILDNSVTGNNDLDALPDNCDDDDDNDGILDVNDNCQFIANQNQLDTDSDGIGDICDPDDDNDGVSDGFDNCPLSYNPYQDDRDNDGLGDVCDTIEINVSDAISPNGDGVNDVWIIYNIENHPNNIVRVFNRWGKEVFKARKYQNNWGGEFGTNPETLPEGGSYYYQIDLDGDGTIDNEGWLYISRK